MLNIWGLNIHQADAFKLHITWPIETFAPCRQIFSMCLCHNLELPKKSPVIGSFFIHAKVLNMNKFSCMFLAPSFTAKLIDLEREEATKKPWLAGSDPPCAKTSNAIPSNERKEECINTTPWQVFNFCHHRCTNPFSRPNPDVTNHQDVLKQHGPTCPRRPPTSQSFMAQKRQSRHGFPLLHCKCEAPHKKMECWNLMFASAWNRTT